MEERDPVAHQMRGIIALGSHEQQRRVRRTRGERAGRGDVRSDGKQTPRRFSRRPLRVSELLGMTSELARKLHADANAESARPSDRKHLAVGYAVMVDKLNALSGRPTEIVGITDDVRPATHDLASKLALVARRSA